MARISGYRWEKPGVKTQPDLTISDPTGFRDIPAGETRTVSYSFIAQTNTQMQVGFGFQTLCDLFADGLVDPSKQVVNVSPQMTIDAVRNGARGYTCTGTTTRTDAILSLYRVADDGRQVLTSQTRARADGSWRIDRRFLGSGRFGFALRTGRDIASAPGTSRVRPTLLF